MFSRRRSDHFKQAVDTSPQQTFIHLLKNIAVMLLRNFKTFTVAGGDEQSQQLSEKLEDYIVQLENVDSLEMLEELEIQIKKIVYARKELEHLQNAERLSALQKLITAAASGLAELAGDSEMFARQLDEHLKGLEAVASQEELEILRETLQRQITQLRVLVESKQEREQQITQTLRRRIQVLEKQLMIANEELVIDALTQVYNRRAFDTRLQEDVKHHATYGGNFALLLFDIDHFKQVNDRHGHLVGDRVLRALAQTAKQVFRMDDFVARYGGEEFAAILYDTGTFYATKAAERFRLAVANKEFQYQQSGEIRSLRLNVSIGVAGFRAEDTPESLIHRADQALYLAKNTGRNRVKAENDLPT